MQDKDRQTDQPKLQTVHATSADAARAQRATRQAAALRENLRRRKEQSRARSDNQTNDSQQGAGDPDPAEDFAPGPALG